MNNTFICAYGYGTAITAACNFHAMDHLGIAQYLTRFGLAADDPSILDAGKNDWLNDPRWQVLRRLVEDTLVMKDPMEMFVAQNLALDGLLYPLIYGSFVDEHLTLKGGTAVAMLTSFMPEWHDECARWVDAVVKACTAESDENKQIVTGWIQAWADRVQAGLAPVAEIALGEHGQEALAEVRTAFNARVAKIGITL